MHLALTALLCTMPAADPPATPPNANIDFASGTTAGWEGDGFSVAPGTCSGPRLSFGVCSADAGKPGRKGTLHRTITVPPTGGVLMCTAFAVRPKSDEPDPGLDVVVLAAGHKVVQRYVRTSAGGWRESGRLLGRDGLKPRHYLWRLDAYAGQTLRVAIVDDDGRKGCHVFCSGFRLLPSDPFEFPDFGKFMTKLVDEHKLAPVARYETKHFTALSNAEEEFTSKRLHNCELIYDLFYQHFRKRGFRIYEPSGKLMVAIFESHPGFEAYMGFAMPLGVTGVYHPKSNRLVVYDYGTNDLFKAVKDTATARGRTIHSDLDRIRYVETVNRMAQEWRTETNISTIMHEVAHQLSFNCGMLNRDGDVPLWLGEGLACYCEATQNGEWQGIGEPNSERLMVLQMAYAGKLKWIRLEDLVSSDAWREDLNGQGVLMGYSEGWALFKMLMEERPQQLRAYMAAISERRAGNGRLDDFTRAFGGDLTRLELRFDAYMREQLDAWKPPR